VPGIIIDYSSREQTEQDLINEIEKANTLCLVYDLNDDESKQKLKTYWLPKIKEIEESFNDNLIKRPIILVANKHDTNERNNVMLNDSFISKLIVNNHQIETCIQCSAKTLKNVPEVFYYAQKSVLYPTAPLYDLESQKLTSKAIKCLTRIFKLCDQDNDGLLNDNELNEFQLKCFGVHLNFTSLQEVKALLNNINNNNNNNNNQDNNNLINNEINLNGFIYLHSLFIKKGRQETTWTVLKKFGYDRNLSMCRDLITNK
jgi:mitochondrial Rho GTPase 1